MENIDFLNEAVKRILPSARILRAEKNGKLTELKDTAIEAAVGLKYSQGKENAILRQRERKPDAFADYDSYCEACKVAVKGRIKEVTGLDV